MFTAVCGHFNDVDLLNLVIPDFGHEEQVETRTPNFKGLTDKNVTHAIDRVVDVTHHII